MRQGATVLGLVLLSATVFVARAQNLELPKLGYEYGAARPAAHRETLLAWIKNVLRKGLGCSGIGASVGAASSTVQAAPLFKAMYLRISCVGLSIIASTWPLSPEALWPLNGID